MAAGATTMDSKDHGRLSGRRPSAQARALGLAWTQLTGAGVGVAVGAGVGVIAGGGVAVGAAIGAISQAIAKTAASKHRSPTRAAWGAVVRKSLSTWEEKTTESTS